MLDNQNDKLNRRNVLKLSGATIATPILGTTAATAAKGESGKRNRNANGIDAFVNFDPNDPQEVAEAARRYLNADAKRAESAIRAWSDEQANAVFAAIEADLRVETSVESNDRISIQSHAGSDNDLTWTYRLVSLGNTVGRVEQFVYWAWEDGELTALDQVSSVDAPGTFWSHSSTITDSTVNMGDEGRATLIEEFEHCITRFGCTITEEVGGTVWVRAGGGWTVNS